MALPANLGGGSHPPPPPDTSLDAAPHGPTPRTDAAFEFSSTEVDAFFECSLDGAEWSPCGSPHTVADLADGVHAFEVRTVDFAGRRDPTAEIWGWDVDTRPPETTLTGAPPTRTSAREARFTFSASADASGFECRLDGAEWSDCASPATYSDLAIGDHVFEVRAFDAAGNLDPSAAARAWRIEVDTTPPNTQISSGPPTRTTDRSATLTFAAIAPEPGDTFECQLDGSGWQACTSPHSYAELAVGGHLFEVRAIDAVGNVDGTPASRRWTTQAPRTPTTPITPTTPANPPSTPGAPGVDAVQLFTDVTPSAFRILRRGIKATVVVPGPGFALTVEVTERDIGGSPGRVISRVRRTAVGPGTIRLRLRPRRRARALVRPGARLVFELRLRPPFGRPGTLRRTLKLGR